MWRTARSRPLYLPKRKAVYHRNSGQRKSIAGIVQTCATPRDAMLIAVFLMMPLVPKLLRIAPELPVSDLHAAIEYYENRLGFRLASKIADSEYAIVERDNVAIHLFRDVAHGAPMAVHVFTSGLDEFYAEVNRRGARVSQPIATKPWGNRDFRVLDESGNELKFTEPLPGETLQRE